MVTTWVCTADQNGGRKWRRGTVSWGIHPGCFVSPQIRLTRELSPSLSRSQSSAGWLRSVARLHGEQHVCHCAREPAFMNSLIRTDRGYTCRSEAGGEGKTKSGVDSGLSARLISAHAGWHKEPWEGSFWKTPPCSFFAVQLCFQLCSNLPENKWPKEKVCRHWGCF